MKHLLLPLFLILTVSPLLANDEGGDSTYIPEYQQLVRDGYGPRREGRDEDLRLGYGLRAAPKPTQAYYANGYTVYYGYSVVPVRTGAASLLYAFGYPVEYFRQMMPTSVNETNLNRYAVSLNNQGNSPYGPGNFVAKAQSRHAGAVTTVQTAQTSKANTTNNSTASNNSASQLPAIGEKPSH